MWAGDDAGASEHFAAERAPDAAAAQGDFAHDAAGGKKKKRLAQP